MAYADEDEIDWSDGSFGDPSQMRTEEATANPNQPIPLVGTHDDWDSLFISDTHGQHRTSCFLPLQSTPVNGHETIQNSTRLQRARTGVHLNRRLPSKADYINYALYQASQKAYEATFLHTFVAHALHPDRIAQCSEDATSGRQSIVEYTKSVSHEVNNITRKMIWNAHCRTIHLLAGDGRDGAPFLDIHSFDSKPFSDCGPGNLFPVADRVNVSWHRTSSRPVMVRYSTKEYELGYQVGPLEEIDQVTHTLFRKENFGRALPTGRAVKLSTAKKRKGQNMPGAAIRDERTASPRHNWLRFPTLDTVSGRHVLQAIADTPLDILCEADTPSAHRGLQPLSDVTNPQHELMGSSPQGYVRREVSHSPLPRSNGLFGCRDSEAPDVDRAGTFMQSNGIEHVDKVRFFRARLIQHHKRRLAQKWGKLPQALDCSVQTFRQAAAAAISMGFRPTSHNYKKKIRTIAAREQYRDHTGDSDQLRNQGDPVSTMATTTGSCTPHGPLVDSTTARLKSASDNLGSTELSEIESPSWPSPESTHDLRSLLAHSEVVKSPLGCLEKKKRKKDEFSVDRLTRKPSATQTSTTSKARNQLRIQLNSKVFSSRKSLSSHPSGSMSLELHQHLPPNAYFQPISEDEKCVWRCAFNHAMGHYYNAGDRKSCRGCNTSLSDNIHVVQMDFYMPWRTFYYQPAPGMPWKPSKQSVQRRKSDRPCHNAVAKDAYWAAMSTGATEEEARQMGVNAVCNYLKPKLPPKTPTPEPKPEPEPDLGPHPSGSTTVEHGQRIPNHHYWEKRKVNEEYAWRCDVNHSLGRYYLAGDKRSCPGCGSSRNGPGKRKEMDFYLPSGVIVRQEAPGLSKWKPRKPYKLSKSPTTKKEPVSHNQMCSKVYFELIAEGHEVDEALRLAVERLDYELDKKQEYKMKREGLQGVVESSDAFQDTIASDIASRRNFANMGQAASSERRQCRRNSRGGYTISLIPKKRTTDDLSNENSGEVAADQEDGDISSGKDSWDNLEMVSSAEENSSASDTE